MDINTSNIAIERVLREAMRKDQLTLAEYERACKLITLGERAALSRSQDVARVADATEDDRGEGLEILDNLIENVSKYGNYSKEATLTFLNQLRLCFAAPQPPQAGASRDDWQQKALDHGFQYWRASDAHGVECTSVQAVELLQDLLGVEVEIKDNGCQTCEGTGVIGGPSYYSPDEGGVPCPDCAPAAPAVAPTTDEFMRVLTEYEGSLQSEDETEIAPARKALVDFMRPIRERIEQEQAAPTPAAAQDERGSLTDDVLMRAIADTAARGHIWASRALSDYRVQARASASPAPSAAEIERGERVGGKS